MITLINQANYLIDKLILSLKEKHMREGGLTEKLYRKKVEFPQEIKILASQIFPGFYKDQ